MLLDKSEIVKRLGIPKKAFKRIVYYGNLRYQLIDNKKYYNFEEVVKVLKEESKK